MKHIEPNNSSSGMEAVREIDADRYFLVEDEDGQLKCSCGRKLIKLDDETYKCEGGYPIYRVPQGEVVIDTYGRLMLKKKKH